MPGLFARLRAAPAADAVVRAQDSFALVGHPEGGWSIVLHARLSQPLDREVTTARIAELSEYPELGVAPMVVTVGVGQVAEAVRMLAEERYVVGGSALRVALVDKPDPGVVLAAHHGALDGLGLIALLALVLGKPVTTSARGVSPDARRRPAFPAFVARRIAEALVHPPTRIAGAPPSFPGTGERLTERSVPAFAGGAAGLTAAGVRTVIRWNSEHGEHARRIAVAIGASQRPGGEPTLENRAAWLRIHVRSGDDEHVATTVARAPSLPVAPRAHYIAGLGRLAGAVLSRRLGSTLLVSNLGRVSGPSELQGVSFYPVTHGRRAVALGAATVGDRTTLTLRAAAKDFDSRSLERLLETLAAELRPRETRCRRRG